MTNITFITSRKVNAVNPTTCRIIISAATIMTLAHHSTTKAGATVIANTTWRVSTEEVATSCTASKSSDVAWCTMAVSLPTGGELSTIKGGFSVTHRRITLLGFGEITTEAPTTKSFYWRKQSVVQPLHQIKTRHRRVQMPTGGISSISKCDGWCRFYLKYRQSDCFIVITLTLSRRRRGRGGRLSAPAGFDVYNLFFNTQPNAPKPFPLYLKFIWEYFWYDRSL